MDYAITVARCVMDALFLAESVRIGWRKMRMIYDFHIEIDVATTDEIKRSKIKKMLLKRIERKIKNIQGDVVIKVDLNEIDNE